MSGKKLLVLALSFLFKGFMSSTIGDWLVDKFHSIFPFEWCIWPLWRSMETLFPPLAWEMTRMSVGSLPALRRSVRWCEECASANQPTHWTDRDRNGLQAYQLLWWGWWWSWWIYNLIFTSAYTNPPLELKLSFLFVLPPIPLLCFFLDPI